MKTEDKNFDILAEKFARNVYGGIKGAIRLAILERDLNEAIARWRVTNTHKALRILDVGAGLGQLSIGLAMEGNCVCINELSENMLEEAQKTARVAGAFDRIEWIEGAYQQLPERLNGQFDHVICHALIKWLAEPELLISRLSRFVHNDSLLSISCYNKNALIYRNLLKGNFNFIERGNFRGEHGSLTPLHPQDPIKVQDMLQGEGWTVRKVTGVRVFNDYSQQRGGNLDMSAVVNNELRYSEQEPYKWLGRYVHFICQRTAA